MIREYLAIAATSTIMGLGDWRMWRDMRKGAVALALLAIRIILLATFPVSFPLLAWLYYRYDRKDEQWRAEVARRLRAEIHMNGRQP